jgi:hypothetical protein
MRKIFLFLASLWLAASANAATVTHRVSTASTANASSYASGAFTPAASDLLVVFVFASDTVAAGGMTDSQTLGWDKITSGLVRTSLDTMYVFVSRATTAASSMTVTFTCTGDAATGAVIEVASVSGMSRVGALAVLQSAKSENQASGGTPAATFGSSALTGNPTLGMVGNATNPATLTTPTNWTERADTGYATPTTGMEYVSRDSGFTGTTITWGSTSASAFGVLIIELDTTATPAAGGVPTLVQRASGSSTQGTLRTKYFLNFPSTTLSGNLIIVGVVQGTAVTTTVTDDAANTYTASTCNGTKVKIFYSANSTAGARKITITFASTGSDFDQIIIAEYYNVATSSPTDGCAATTGNSGTMATGSFSTTNDGDLIWNVGVQNGVSQVNTFTAGSGFTLETADTYDGHVSQKQVQSAHAAINPSITFTTANAWETTAQAFKPASAGTAPAAGKRVIGIYHNNVAVTTSPLVLAAPTVGSMIVASWTGGPGDTPTAVSDTSSNAWTSSGASVNFGASGEAMLFYTGGTATTSSTMTISTTRGGTPGTTSTMLFYDMTGMAASPFDRRVDSSGNSASTSTTGSTVIPASVGIIITNQPHASSTQTGISPGLLDTMDMTPRDASLSPADENNGNAHEINTDTASRTYVWTSSIAPGNWASLAVAFKEQAAAGGPPHQLPTMGCCAMTRR